MAYITLISDFGLQDATVAIAKGILMQYMPSAGFIDITHEVEPFNKKQAAYLLGAAYEHFPEGTFHIPIMDIFSSRHPALVLCAYRNHYFLAPDNGLVPLFLPPTDAKAWLCLELSESQSFHDWLHKAGEVIKALSTTLPENLGYPERKLKNITPARNEQHGVINAEVVHIDTYGNVVLDVNRKMIQETNPAYASFLLKFIQYEEIKEISTDYNDVREGYKLCRFNSHGHLEICINKGSAANLFGLRMGSIHNNIQIILK